MKENTKLNWSFWLSLLAFVISIVALAVFFCKVKPYCVVTIDTYIGVIAGFIGISVTLLVGYQIYNALDLRQRITAVETLKISMESQQQQLEVLKNEQAEGIEIIQARLFLNTPRMALEAFLHFHSAIRYSLSVDHRREGYKWLLNELNEYMLGISNRAFVDCISQKDFQNKINELKSFYQEYDREIRNHANYLYIRDGYEELMSKFEKRLDNIANLKNVSLEVLDGLA